MSTKLKVLAGVIVGVVVLIIILIAISLGKLDSDQVGLMYDPVAKHLDTDPLYEGLHNGPPAFSFIIFPSVFETLTYNRLQCLNRDGVEIQLSISYQYRVRPNNLYSIVEQFRDHHIFEDILHMIGQSAIHDACTKFNTSQFQAERGAFQEEVRKRLVFKYDQVATDVTDLQVNDIRRPKQYENSVKRKESAREDIEVARQEKPRYMTEAETKRRESETQAQIIVQKAESDARNQINKARAEALAILNEYEKEAESYSELQNSLRLTPEGMLAYLGVRVIADASSPVQISLKSPASSTPELH